MYKPPALLFNGHLQTMYPAVLRRAAQVAYAREKLDTPDGDFLDLDWSRTGARRLAVISHGMEASSRSKYVLGMARALNGAGWDTLAWNCRGCGGEPNRKLRFYHSGSSDDLATVLQHTLRADGYSEIVLVGFSIGGNLTLKYLGEQGAAIAPKITKAAVFSVPCDLASSASALSRLSNVIYMQRFLYFLRRRIRQKARAFPGEISAEPLTRIKTFEEFDNIYTAPIHGYRDAAHYWRECSSRYFLGEIRIPALIVNALNDPFLGELSFPRSEAAKNQRITLETPAHGGHVGFVEFSKDGLYWSERRTLAFFNHVS